MDIIFIIYKEYNFMNYIILSPHLPANYYYFCRSLSLLGNNVLGIGSANYNNLKPELREMLTEYYKVNDLCCYDDILKACGYFTHRYGKINFINSLNEQFLHTDAKLRLDFNVQGFSLESLNNLEKFENNTLTKSIAYYENIETGYFTSILNAHSNIIFPMVYKQVEKLGTSYLVTEPDLIKVLKEMTYQFMSQLDISNSVFNFRFRIIDNCLTIDNIVPAPFSGISFDLFNYSTDSDIYQCWANTVSNKSVETEFNYKYFTALIPRSSSRQYIMTHQSILNKYSKYLVHHGNFRDIGSDKFIGDYAYIVRHEDKNELQNIINEIIC